MSKLQNSLVLVCEDDLSTMYITSILVKNNQHQIIIQWQTTVSAFGLVQSPKMNVNPISYSQRHFLLGGGRLHFILYLLSGLRERATSLAGSGGEVVFTHQNKRILEFAHTFSPLAPKLHATVWSDF